MKPLERAIPAPKFSSATPIFEQPKALLSPPLELTRAKLRGLNMVDETIIIHEEIPKEL